MGYTTGLVAVTAIFAFSGVALFIFARDPSAYFAAGTLVGIAGSLWVPTSPPDQAKRAQEKQPGIPTRRRSRDETL